MTPRSPCPIEAAVASAVAALLHRRADALGKAAATGVTVLETKLSGATVTSTVVDPEARVSLRLGTAWRELAADIQREFGGAP